LDRIISIFLVFSLMVNFIPGYAEDVQNSKYAGQQNREIKSLSPEDILELRRGGGWGLAKAAELNGVPGPAHLLELKSEIDLTDKQIKALRIVYDEMKRKAIRKGEELINLETNLEKLFVERTINDNRLRSLLTDIALVRGELRYIHLSTHLKTPEILSESQIIKYNIVRGYSNNPCLSVPAGHNPEMWRKHNGCR